MLKRIFRIKEEATTISPPTGNEVESVGNTAVLEQFHSEIGQKFTEFFLKRVPNLRLLNEFIYGVDQLVEIAKGVYWEEPCALNNPDIDNLVGSRFKLTAGMLQDNRLRGVAVSPETYNLIAEFFDRDYLFIIGQLIDRETGVGLFQFPYYTHSITLSVRRLPFPDFYSLLEFRDDFTQRSICFPFITDRLTQETE